MPMFTQAIESRTSKIAICIVGIVTLPIVLVSAAHGLVFLIGITSKPEIINICFGLSSILGLLGYFAAWYRPFKNHKNMSAKQILFIRFLLFCGIVSSILLLGCVIYFKLGLFAVSFLLLLILGGFAFVSATPKGI